MFFFLLMGQWQQYKFKHYDVCIINIFRLNHIYIYIYIHVRFRTTDTACYDSLVDRILSLFYVLLCDVLSFERDLLLQVTIWYRLNPKHRYNHKARDRQAIWSALPGVCVFSSLV